jgi:hypothetical protein
VTDHFGGHQPRVREPVVLWWRRWWGQLIAGVLTVGAVAGAVGSVKALWPSSPPDLADKAAFTSVIIRSPLPLSEYKERLKIVPQPAQSLEGYGAVELVAAQQPTASVDDPIAPTSTGTTEPSAPSNTSSPPSNTSSPPPTKSDAPENTPSGSGSSATITAELPSAPLWRQQTLSAAEDIIPRVRDRAPQYFLRSHLGNRSSGGIGSIVAAASSATDENGDPVPADIAAERVVKLLHETRTQPLDGKLDPLGVLLTINVELEGLRNRPVVLTWRMFQAGGNTPLFGNWLGTTPAYRLDASTEHDTASFDLWVPLPRERGAYTVSLLLSSDQAILASEESPAFV